jgi:hypothetical protein
MYLRVPYVAQMKREDTPILPNEHLATMLSEDFSMIRIIEQFTRAFEINPKFEEISVFLEKSILNGFYKKKALK